MPHGEDLPRAVRRSHLDTHSELFKDVNLVNDPATTLGGPVREERTVPGSHQFCLVPSSAS